MKPILVVEDDTDIRETLEQALDAEGYQVTTAIHGRDALEKLATMDPPGLILLDLMMPDMNGWQFIEAKKQNPLLAGIPVVVITAAGEKAKSAQADGFIKKPIDLDDLLNTVAQFCS